jgi:hypothetical protein
MKEWKFRSAFYNSGQCSNIGLDSKSLFVREVKMRALAIPSHEIDNAKFLLQEALISLKDVRDSISEPLELLEAFDELSTYVEYVQGIESSDRTTRKADIVAPLRSMLFSFCPRFISTLHAGPNVMLLKAHLHAIALLVNPAQDNESGFFRRLNVPPIQAFHEELAMRAALEVEPGQGEGQYGRALAMMDFSLNAVAAFERRLLRFGCSRKQRTRVGELGVGFVNDSGCLSTLNILQNFPVGLWHNSVS